MTTANETPPRAKTRERKDDFHSCVIGARQLIRELFREQLSHVEFLDRRNLIIHTEKFRRLTAAHQCEILGMLRGAIEAAYVTALVWCHWIHGRYLTGKELPDGVSYQDIDSNESQYCWATTRKVFSGSGTEVKS